MNDSIYQKVPELVLGFHGTTQTVAKKVVNQEENLKHSDNDYDWLGSGIYFWQNNELRALKFAEDAKKRKHLTDAPKVVGAVLDLGICLDLLQSKNLQEVKSAHIYLPRIFKNSGTQIPQNIVPNSSGDKLVRNLDCAVIAMVHEIRKQKYNAISLLESMLRTFSYYIKKKGPNNEDFINCIFLDVIKLIEDNYLQSVLSPEDFDLIVQMWKSYREDNIDSDAYLKFNKMIDGIRIMALEFLPYDSVRGMFVEGKPLYEDAGFREEDHIQICICNPNCIKGIFYPRQMDVGYVNP